MAKGMLESAGVECFLVGENANSLLPAAFRVRLQVRVEDEAAARELMAQSAGVWLAKASRMGKPRRNWGGEGADSDGRRSGRHGGS